jgi:SAM-dependent methyltransferase
MNDSQRSQIRDNARYLRQVRPLDPAEISEYVEGTPHPAAVRQVLREQAPELGLLEREDGRFEPVEEGPVEVQLEAVDTLPDTITRAIEDSLVDRFGTGWPDGESGAQLRPKIRDFKRRYLRGETVTYDEATALGYAIYHLPSYFAAAQYVLADLASEGLLPSHLRILDVGAGVGGPALGIDTLVPEGTLVEYHAVEPSDAAPILETMLEETGRNFHATVHGEPIEEFAPDREDPYDIVLFANVLSELDEPVDVVSGLLDRLAPDGTVVALAPADRNTAIQLREHERALERETELSVYGPTVRLWPDEYPESESWSFRRHPALPIPPFQRRLDEGNRTDEEQRRESADEETSQDSAIRPAGSGEFVNVDVQYAYSLLRLDGKRAIEFQPDPESAAKMAAMDDHVTDRIDCVAVKLSHDLSDGGNPLYLVGDGSQQIDHFAVVTSSSALNRDLETAEYGDLLSFENVLVLWNDDERAYNLVIDDETYVDRIPV